jgi:DNA polymerase-3 subunit epsilon
VNGDQYAPHLIFIGLNFAIVDIETTGGSAKMHAITEIAIITLCDGKQIDSYQTLINPEMFIPDRITSITGISNEMVRDAPVFKEVAQEIWKRTSEAVFVAHNVNFDYGFIREQFGKLGMIWRPKRLCTVRLSRKLMPGLYSYSLGKIAAQMGRTIADRHRAMGDCAFTADLFMHLQRLDTEDHIAFSLNARTREATLPPLLKRERFDDFPSGMGVYIFKGAKGKVLYVGKANNLKQRVSDHFRGNTHTGWKNRFAEQIEDLDWILCPNELIALLTEAILIKRHWPPFNRLMKRVSLNWGIYRYTDQLGFERFSIGRVGKWDKPVYSFRTRLDATIRLEFLCKRHQLCPKYCGLTTYGESCADRKDYRCTLVCEGSETNETYNQRAEEALAELQHTDRTMLITGKGFTSEERSVILIEAGRYKGHGMVPKNVDLEALNEVKAYLETGYDDQDIQTVIMSHLSKKSADQEVVVIT